jgi:DNA polymerase III alpha subunit (gram-positive type)
MDKKLDFGQYIPYVCDVETTNIDYDLGDIIEISLKRLTDNAHKTWYLKAINIENIDMGALKVNGHKYEDITWKTFEGRQKYLEPAHQLIEIEKFILEDNSSQEWRLVVGHNVSGFDIPYIKSLYKRNKCMDQYPFGIRAFDTMQIEMFAEFAKDPHNVPNISFSLSSRTKEYGLKNEKAHSAEMDVKVTADYFLAVLDKYRNFK